MILRSRVQRKRQAANATGHANALSCQEPQAEGLAYAFSHDGHRNS
jgi:hypothetical protein